MRAAVPVARKLLAAPVAEIEVLWERSFGDEEAHNDGLQAQLDRDFAAAFDAARSELNAEFGPMECAGEMAGKTVPVAGVFRTAIWSVGDRQLWLAATHEDRELPFLLLLGTALA